MIGFGARIALYFGDRHLAGLGKQLSQMTLVLRVQMLNQHECHAGIGRQMAEQLRECLQSAGGGSDSDDWKRTAPNAFPGRPPVDADCGCWVQGRFRGVPACFGGPLWHARLTCGFEWCASTSVLHCHTAPMPLSNQGTC